MLWHLPHPQRPAALIQQHGKGGAYLLQISGRFRLAIGPAFVSRRKLIIRLGYGVFSVIIAASIDFCGHHAQYNQLQKDKGQNRRQCRCNVFYVNFHQAFHAFIRYPNPFTVIKNAGSEGFSSIFSRSLLIWTISVFS